MHLHSHPDLHPAWVARLQGVCALLIHPGVWSQQRGNIQILDRLAMGDETLSTCVPGWCNLLPSEHCVSVLQPTVARVSVESVKVEARVTGRPRASRGRVSCLNDRVLIIGL